MANLMGPTLTVTGTHTSRLQVGTDGVKEMEHLERAHTLRVEYDSGIVGFVPLSNVKFFAVVNAASLKKFKSHAESIAPVAPPPAAPPKPVRDDTVKL
jgi:hypothetical protein